MSSNVFEQAMEAALFLRQRSGNAPGNDPKIAILLGSGLGEIAEKIEASLTIPYSEIPHFPRTTVTGHSGHLVFGNLNGIPVAVLQGRVHGYEGYRPQQVTFPMRVLGVYGIATVIVTNAAGGLCSDLHQGELVLISDHINLTGSNPLTGWNDDNLGPRFPDMTDAYPMRLRLLAHSAAKTAGFVMKECVYLGVPGPSYETPAEIRAFRAMGADLVGMSTVHEVIVARHMGMQVLALSCVTNLAAGMLPQKIEHQDVLATGLRVQDRLGNFLAALVRKIHVEGGAREEALL